MEDKTHIFYNISNFNELFISNLDFFDDYFSEIGNNLVNSNEYYLRYKEIYINETTENFIIFKTLVKSFDLLNNNYTKTHETKKYIYNYIDSNECNNLNNKLKNILEVQKKKLNDFTNYIKLLNTQDNKIVSKIDEISRISKLN